VVGGFVTVNVPTLVAVPPPVVTLHLPDVAPAGTVTVIDLLDATENGAARPFSFTDVAAVNRVPVSLTFVPTGPVVGENPVIVGGLLLVVVNEAALDAVPPGVETRHFPSDEPVPGTTAVIDVEDSTMKLALTNPRVTVVAPMKFVPVIVTLDPTGPFEGEKPVIVGVLSENCSSASSGTTTAFGCGA
jgi:hypothetical protein